MSNYYYKQSEKNLWTVGTGEGKEWVPESDHGTPQEAAARVNFLNGGGITFTMEEINAKANKSFEGQVEKIKKELCDLDELLLEGGNREFSSLEIARLQVRATLLLAEQIAYSNQLKAGI